MVEYTSEYKINDIAILAISNDSLPSCFLCGPWWLKTSLNMFKQPSDPMADITVCIATVAAGFPRFALEYLFHFHGDERIVADVADLAICCKLRRFGGARRQPKSRRPWQAVGAKPGLSRFAPLASVAPFAVRDVCRCFFFLLSPVTCCLSPSCKLPLKAPLHA